MPVNRFSLHVKTFCVLNRTSELFIKFVVRLVRRKIETIETKIERERERERRHR